MRTRDTTRVMLSLKHIHCENILCGKKTSELRTKSPYQPTPYGAYLYDCASSGGVGMVVGECDVYDDVGWRMCVGVPAHLSKAACISNSEIWEYSGNGKKVVHELRLRNVKRYETPKPLSEFGLKRPPQSWCYAEPLK